MTRTGCSVRLMNRRPPPRKPVAHYTDELNLNFKNGHSKSVIQMFNLNACQLSQIKVLLFHRKNMLGKVPRQMCRCSCNSTFPEQPHRRPPEGCEEGPHPQACSRGMRGLCGGRGARSLSLRWLEVHLGSASPRSREQLRATARTRWGRPSPVCWSVFKGRGRP